MYGPSSPLASGILQTAEALGIDPVDLATAISYETGGTFDPLQSGPTTKWGQHRGLIQFGEPQAEKYGVDWSNPLGSQLGPQGAVANYLRASGLKPGMGLLDLYSTINAGAPGRYNASDAAVGGAPGTVADKVSDQMAWHRENALRLLGRPDIRMASTDMGDSTIAGMTDVTGDPVTGRMDIPMQDPMQQSYLHPAVQAAMGQNQSPSGGLWEALIAAGGAMGTPGAGWLNRGATAFGRALQQQQQDPLRMLTASTQLYELEDKRRQRMAQRSSQQALVQRLRAEGKDAEADALDANMLTNQDLGAALGIEQPGKEASYGTGMNLVDMGTDENGKQRWGTLRLASDGSQKIEPLPEGFNPRYTPGFEGNVAEARKYGELSAQDTRDLTVNTSDSLMTVNNALDGINTALDEFEQGMYQGTGALAGRVKEWMGDPDAAIIQFRAVGAALQNLQITNLAPVTEKEIALIMKLYMNVDRTPAQNKAILGELQKSLSRKREILQKTMEMIEQGKTVYEIKRELPALYVPKTSAGGPAAPQSAPQSQGQAAPPAAPAKASGGAQGASGGFKYLGPVGGGF